jgi:hypothetical protein
VRRWFDFFWLSVEVSVRLFLSVLSFSPAGDIDGIAKLAMIALTVLDSEMDIRVPRSILSGCFLLVFPRFLIKFYMLG